MRSHNFSLSRRSAMEDWQAVFQQQLHGGGKDDRHDLLLPTVLLDELDGVTRGLSLGFEGPHRHHWKKLGPELDATRSGIGPKTASTTQLAWDAVAAALSTRDAPRNELDAVPLVDAVRALRSQLTKPEVRQVAWDDALAAHREDFDPETSERRICVLGDLCTLAGLDWRTWSRHLAGAINDNIIDLVALGWPRPSRYDPDNLNDRACLPMDTRLDICRAGLTRRAKRVPITAWLGFNHAQLDTHHLAIGPVEIWPGTAFPDLRDQNGVRPKELTSRVRDLFFPEAVEGPWVLMRIDLGLGTRAGAIERARAIASTILRMPDEQPSWELMDGAVIVAGTKVGGQPMTPSKASDHIRDFKRAKRVARDVTDEHLQALGVQIATEVVHRHDQVDDVASDLAWYESLDSIPDSAQRASLAIRLIERRLPPTGDPQKHGNWAFRARWWLQSTWSLHQMLDEIEDAVFEGIVEPFRPEDDELADLHDRIYVRKPKHRYEIDLAEATLGLGEVAAHLDPSDMAERIVRSAAMHLRDGPAMLTRLEVFDGRFDRLLARTNRVRNATLHGDEIVSSVADSVANFASWMAGVLATESLAALRSGESLDARLHRMRDRRLRDRERLAVAKDVAFLWSSAETQ